MSSQRGTAPYRRATAALGLFALATFSVIYVVQPNFALLAGDFSAAASSTSLSLSVTTLALACTVLPIARLSGSLGRGRTMTAGLLLAVAASLAAAFAPGLPHLLVVRALVGVGCAAVTGVALAWVADEVGGADATHLGGVYIAATTVGGMVGRLLGGGLAEVGGWRVSVAGVSALCMALAVAGGLLLPRRGVLAAERRARRTTLADTAAPPALRPPPTPAPPPASAAPTTTQSNPAGPSEAAPARSRPAPPPARVLATLHLLGGLGMFAFVGVFTAIVFRAAQPPLSMGPGVTSLFFLTYLAGTLTSARASTVAGRLGVRRSLLVGLAVAMVGVLVTAAPHPLAIWVGLLVMSAGFFLVHALASATGPRLAARAGQPAGRVSGRYTFAYYVGSSLGGVALGAAWDAAGWLLVEIGALAALALAFLAAARLRPEDLAHR